MAIRILPDADASFGSLMWMSEGSAFQSNPTNAKYGTSDMLTFHAPTGEMKITNHCHFDVIISCDDEHSHRSSMPFSMVIPAKTRFFSYASLTTPDNGYYRLRPVMVQVTPPNRTNRLVKESGGLRSMKLQIWPSQALTAEIDDNTWKSWAKDRNSLEEAYYLIISQLPIATDGAYTLIINNYRQSQYQIGILNLGTDKKVRLAATDDITRTTLVDNRSDRVIYLYNSVDDDVKVIKPGSAYRGIIKEYSYIWGGKDAVYPSL